MTKIVIEIMYIELYNIHLINEIMIHLLAYLSFLIASNAL